MIVKVWVQTTSLNMVRFHERTFQLGKYKTKVDDIFPGLVSPVAMRFKQTLMFKCINAPLSS